MSINTPNSQVQRMRESPDTVERTPPSEMRLLGIQIANGFSSEARVFATLLQNTDPGRVARHVLFNSWEGDTASLEKFRALSGASLHPLDFGWRSMAPGRPMLERIRGRLRFARALQQALPLARQLAPDVIYSCQQLWDCQAATFLARRLGKPQVVHLHFTVGPYLHKPVLQRLHTCDHVLTVSDYIRDMTIQEGVSPERVTTLLNSIEVRPPLPPETRQEVFDEFRLPADTLLMGIFARVDFYKGQADTLRAFARAVEVYPNARLLIAGGDTSWDPGYTEKMKQLAAELKITDKALFVGMRADIPRLLSALNIFVHPSRMDPCPLAVLEAAAAGLPVVAYADGGVSEILREGEDGLLVAPEDVDGLTAAMLRLLGDETLRLKMGAQARERMATAFHPRLAGEAFTTFLSRYAPAVRSTLPT